MSDYNGWANYETWAVNLHLANDHGSYLLALEVAEEHDDRHDLADAYEEMIRGWLAVGVEVMPDLAADLLIHAIDGVDWLELADEWITKREEEVTA